MRPVLLLGFAIIVTSASGPATASDKDAILALAKDLKAKDAKTRAKAADELGKMGPDAAIVSRELCDAVLDTNGAVSLAAFKALEQVRPDLYKPLSKLMLDNNDEVKAQGILDLQKLGDEAKPASFVVVSYITYSAAKATPKTGTKLTAPEKAAYDTLAKIGYDEADILKQLKALAGPGMKWNIHRVTSMGLLIAWAGDDESRRKELLPLVKAGLETPLIQIGFIELAANYGALSKDFLPGLKQLKLSPDKKVRDAATSAVEAIEAALKK